MQTSHDPDALPQLIGEFRPVDVWQEHINQVFYGLCSAHVRDFYQTFAAADYRLGYALAEDYYRRLCARARLRHQSDNQEKSQRPSSHLTANASRTCPTVRRMC